MAQTISEKGLQLLKEFEGFSAEAYLDGAGVPTIGHGTTRIGGRPVRLGMICSGPDAESWLREDVATAEAAVNALDTFPEHQFDALVCLVYNIGTGAFRKSSLRAAIEWGKPITEDLFTRWSRITVNGQKVVSPGLLARRKREYALFSEAA